MNDIVPELIGLILLFISAPIGKAVGKFLKEKISGQKHSNLYDATAILVRYAQKKISSNPEKFEYVQNRLKKKFKWASGIKIGEMIECAVSNMTGELGEQVSSDSNS